MTAWANRRRVRSRPRRLGRPLVVRRNPNAPRPNPARSPASFPSVTAWPRRTIRQRPHGLQLRRVRRCDPHFVLRRLDRQRYQHETGRISRECGRCGLSGHGTNNTGHCRHRQPERKPISLLGGHGLGGRFRHYVDQLRPGRGGQRLRRGREWPKRRLRPALQCRLRPLDSPFGSASKSQRRRHADHRRPKRHFRPSCDRKWPELSRRHARTVRPWAVVTCSWAIPIQASDVFQVNQTAAGNQQNARVAMDAAGDFTVAWESSPSGSPGSYDIYMRRYARTSLVQYAVVADTNPNDNALRHCCWPAPISVYGANGEMGGEVPVNSTKTGDQALSRCGNGRYRRCGDRLERLWKPKWQADSQGVFYQRFAQTTDTAGPTVGAGLECHRRKPHDRHAVGHEFGGRSTPASELFRSYLWRGPFDTGRRRRSHQRLEPEQLATDPQRHRPHRRHRRRPVHRPGLLAEQQVRSGYHLRRRPHYSRQPAARRRPVHPHAQGLRAGHLRQQTRRRLQRDSRRQFQPQLHRFRQRGRRLVRARQLDDPRQSETAHYR